MATRDGESFWSERHTEIDESPAINDGVATSSTTIDIESYRERQHQLERELSGVGSVDLELAVTYETPRTQETLGATTALQITEDAYWLSEPLATSDENSYQVSTKQTTESRSLGMIGGLSILGTLSLVAAGVVARRPPVDEEAARRAVHEKRYAEWISQGSIPMWVGNHHISLDTLEDVVDTEIDMNERVVHDRQRGLFAVVNGEVVYYCTDRGLWEETTWPNMNLTKKESSDGDGPAFTPDEVALEDVIGSTESDEVSFDDDEDVWRQL